MNGPYRAHPALPLSVKAVSNTIPFPNAPKAVLPPKPQEPSKLERLVAIEGEISSCQMQLPLPYMH